MRGDYYRHYDVNGRDYDARDDDTIREHDKDASAEEVDAVDAMTMAVVLHVHDNDEAVEVLEEKTPMVECTLHEEVHHFFHCLLLLLCHRRDF